MKNIFIIKNLTHFRKTVEAGVDPRLSLSLACFANVAWVEMFPH